MGSLSSIGLVSCVATNSGVIQGFVIRSNDKTSNCSFFVPRYLRTMASRTLSTLVIFGSVFVYARVVKSVRKSSTTEVASRFL